jgi:hypothetical protein
MIDFGEIVQRKKCEECKELDAVKRLDIGRMRFRVLIPPAPANVVTVVQVCESCSNKEKYSRAELEMDGWSSRHRVGS